MRRNIRIVLLLLLTQMIVLTITIINIVQMLILLLLLLLLLIIIIIILATHTVHGMSIHMICILSLSITNVYSGAAVASTKVLRQTYIYIYIYRERERKRCMYVYIYIYIYVFFFFFSERRPFPPHESAQRVHAPLESKAAKAVGEAKAKPEPNDPKH